MKNSKRNQDYYFSNWHEDLLELEKEEKVMKKRLEGKSFFLTYFTSLPFLEIKQQLNCIFENFRVATQVKMNYGAGYTKSGKWHIHLLIRFDQEKCIKNPSCFNLYEPNGKIIQGHYETCIKEELVLLYLKRHEDHNVVLQEIGTIADINDAKKSSMILDAYEYSKNFEGLNETERLQKCMNYLLAKHPERLNHFTLVESTLVKLFKNEKNQDPFHVDREVKIINSYPESSSKEVWEKELETVLRDYQGNLCFSNAKDKDVMTWLVKALINTGTDPEKIGIIPSMNIFFKNVHFLANKERLIAEVGIMNELSVKELNNFQTMFLVMTQINKVRIMESGKKRIRSLLTWINLFKSRIKRRNFSSFLLVLK